MSGGEAKRLLVRTRPTHLAFLLLAVLSIIALLIPYSSPVRGQRSIDVELRDDLTFSPDRIAVSPGENITLRLINVGGAQHTFTLFVVPNDVVPIEPFSELQAYYDRTDKIVDVWLLGGEEATVSFTAPTTEAEYAVVCMIIGHAALGMVGVLVVGEPDGVTPPPGFVWPLGLIQTILVIALAGTAVFAAVYHLQTTRR